MVKNVKCHLKKHCAQASANIQQELSDFLRTYRNVPHSTTNLAPTHLMLAKAPCTHLAMTLPSVANQLKQHLLPNPSQAQPRVRKFACGDSVMVHDFRPTSTLRWQRGTIIKVHGELTYQVDCDGHQHEVHVDHLIPATASGRPDKSMMAPVDDQHTTGFTSTSSILQL